MNVNYFLNADHKENYDNLISYWSAGRYGNTGFDFYCEVYLLATPEIFASISDIEKCFLPDPSLMMPYDVITGDNIYGMLAVFPEKWDGLKELCEAIHQENKFPLMIKSLDLLHSSDEEFRRVLSQLEHFFLQDKRREDSLF